MHAPSTGGGRRTPTQRRGDPRGTPQQLAAQRTARRAAQRERAGAPDVHVEGGVRLQKVLAGAGLGSRRACETMIAAGRVAVDGTVVREAGVRIDPASAEVAVDGLPLQLDATRTYLAVNKARGVLSTMHDPAGRPSLEAYASSRGERLFHVGRLDADTEGLIILTNDGDLAHHLAHPSNQVPKTYLAEVRVDGPNVARDVGARLRAGVELDDGPARVDSFRLVDSVPGRAVVELVLHDGRKHVVRRLLAAVDLPVDRLVRTRIGPVHLGDMRPGSRRALNDLVQVLFTATPDLSAEFPAVAARAVGLGAVPLMCAVEIDVPGAMPRVVRLMALATTERSAEQVRHVYLRGAAALRRDIAQ